MRRGRRQPGVLEIFESILSVKYSGAIISDAMTMTVQHNRTSPFQRIPALVLRWQFKQGVHEHIRRCLCTNLLVQSAKSSGFLSDIQRGLVVSG